MRLPGYYVHIKALVDGSDEPEPYSEYLEVGKVYYITESPYSDIYYVYNEDHSVVNEPYSYDRRVNGKIERIKTPTFYIWADNCEPNFEETHKKFNETLNNLLED